MSLIRQIMTESMVIVTVAALIGVVLAMSLLGVFNQLTGIVLNMNDLRIEVIIAAIVGVVVLTGLFAGSYPAFYLSSFEPAQVLKGKVTSAGATWLRRSLVVFQFVIETLLICGTIVMSQQMDFIRSTSLGFNTDAKIVLPLRSSQSREKYSALKQSLASMANVNGVAATTFVPGGRILYDAGFFPAGSGIENAIQHQINPVDEDYLGVMDFKMAAGKPLSKDYVNAPGNVARIVINETAVAALGFTLETAVGQTIYNQNNDQRVANEIVGIMKDFHQTNLHEKIKPTIFYIPLQADFDNLVVSVNTSDLKETIESINNAWTSVVADTPFEFHFMDEAIQKQYEFDNRNERMINIFSLIAISISCLGLYALSAFMTEIRQREIGVRKVMGASVGQVAVLMSSEYLKLIAIALIISIPLAWIGASRWLESFAYRMPASISPFMLTGIVVVAIAAFTVGFETIKAACANPTKSLRSEQ